MGVKLKKAKEIVGFYCYVEDGEAVICMDGRK